MREGRVLGGCLGLDDGMKVFNEILLVFPAIPSVFSFL